MARKKTKYYVRPDGIHEASRKIDGKRVVFRGRTDAEVEKKMIAYKGKRERGEDFDKILSDWWDEHQQRVASNTLKGYSPAVRRAIDHFKGIPVKSVTAEMIDAFITEFGKKGYARKTCNTQLLVIREALDYAILKNELSVNPSKAVKVSKALPKSVRKPPSRDEVKLITEHINDKDCFIGVLIYYTGMRIGECMGLRWEDIDRNEKTIYVRRNVYYKSTTPFVKEPKTEKGIREIPILNTLYNVLPKKSHGYVFAEPDGSLLRRHHAERVYKIFQKASGVTSTAHQLRHGYATALYEAKIDFNMAKQLLGHAQISTTIDLYTEIRKDQVKNAADQLNDFM